MNFLFLCEIFFFLSHFLDFFKADVCICFLMNIIIQEHHTYKHIATKNVQKLSE